MYINYFQREMFGNHNTDPVKTTSANANNTDPVETTSANANNTYPVDPCDIDVADMIGEPLTIDDCKKYSNKDYKKLRDDYLGKITEIIENDKSDKTLSCLKNKITENNKESEAKIKEYEETINEELKDVTADQQKIIENRQKMTDLQSNIVATEQRLSDSGKNNYRNKVKLIVFIVSIIVFIIIELILIIV